MNDVAQLLMLLALIVISIVWFFSPRLVIIPSMAKGQAGSTSILLGGGNLNLVDSPKAACGRAGTPVPL